ncbi:tRNA 2-selenouridine(34) synthase MnmH [Rhodocytophaga rosea]|uniref:tRNA 2-selenouridine(34) synthase MnmH n=1 Tax=Rhodocytophaga rosea TaxID=2704465 RepID=A0A6C0GQR8_9BACT|nr:tRNA 2-selenouridine(34) synthase MnmH [Rhodocytophaga rosea]QHT70401.1 tRNA 2-selenouridine(34) synthase MnmH [Rhodocytophaga rosea]
MSSLVVNDFLEKAQALPVIDVRSPGEFAHGHIPGAYNIPLFDNEERAKVGTKYKQVSKEAAILLGLDIVGPKMSGFVKSAKKLAPAGEALVHCWRGGMRSGSFAWLLGTTGFKVDTLQKGYKAYRQEVLHLFEQPFPFIVLGGKTGSGKTELLQELARAGEQVIDLEGLAHHKGSSFGAIGELPQPTTEQFENNLHAALHKLDLRRRIWVEDESITIGTVRLPAAIYNRIRQAPVIFIDVPKLIRIERLVQDYTGFDHHLLEQALERIKKRMGGLHFNLAMEALHARDYATVADLSLAYYDKAYLFGLDKRDTEKVYTLPLAEESLAEKVEKVIETADAFIQKKILPK